MTPYQILGIPETASKTEIKAAFNLLAKRYHPDKNPGDKKAEEKFKQISSAYTSLIKGNPKSTPSPVNNSIPRNYHVTLKISNILCSSTVNAEGYRLTIPAGTTDGQILHYGNIRLKVFHPNIDPFYVKDKKLYVKIALEKRETKKGSLIKIPVLRYIWFENDDEYFNIKLKSDLKLDQTMLISDFGIVRPGGSRAPLYVDITVIPNTPILKRIFRKKK